MLPTRNECRTRICRGIFTNLTHDHLDYHKTFERYLAAKKSWFDSLPETAFALVNADDRNGMVMLQNCKARHYTFSMRGMADFRCGIIEQSFQGMGLRIMGEEVWTKFIGDYNAFEPACSIFCGNSARGR